MEVVLEEQTINRKPRVSTSNRVSTWVSQPSAGISQSRTLSVSTRTSEQVLDGADGQDVRTLHLTTVQMEYTTAILSTN